MWLLSKVTFSVITTLKTLYQYLILPTFNNIYDNPVEFLFSRLSDHM
jgi:hypothetical protein